MDKLNEVNTDKVEPLIHMSAEINVLREDVASNSLTHEEALKNAPKKDSDYFRVPKFLG
jgi:aspartyl-tRNA(Asn)/glutamyl-tRNA(Gln) amidotransferase subunit C